MHTYGPVPIITTAGRIAAVVVLAAAFTGCGSGMGAGVTPPSASPPTMSGAATPSGHQPGASTSRPPGTPSDSRKNALVTWEHHPVAKSDLDASTRARWFFGHQSVGANVLKGVTSLYKANGLGKPIQIDVKGSASLPSTGGFIAHAHVGRNGHPLEKLAEFDAILRSGVASEIDAAVLKFCYSDVRAGRVDVLALFGEYRRVLADLERDFPDVTFLHATVPLKADTAADNVARTQMNALLREEFGATRRLWDIAAIESTTLEGQPVGGVHEGQPYQALHSGFTRDGGHLYVIGTEVAAGPLLELVVRAAA